MKRGTDDIHQSVLGANCGNQSSSLKNLVRREKLSRFCMRVTLLSVLPWSTATGCSSTQRACSPCGCTHKTWNQFIFVQHRELYRLYTLFYFFWFIFCINQLLLLRSRLSQWNQRHQQYICNNKKHKLPIICKKKKKCQIKFVYIKHSLTRYKGFPRVPEILENAWISTVCVFF